MSCWFRAGIDSNYSSNPKEDLKQRNYILYLKTFPYEIFHDHHSKLLNNNEKNHLKIDLSHIKELKILGDNIIVISDLIDSVTLVQK